MPKLSFEEWFFSVTKEASAELRAKLNKGEEENPIEKAILKFFEEGGIDKSESRLSQIKEMINVAIPTLDLSKITIQSITPKKMEPTKFSFMKFTANPNGHDYGTSYMLVTRVSQGFKQDGSIGASIPENCDLWKVAEDDSKVEELAKKFIPKIMDKSTNIHDYFIALKPLLSAIVDMKDFE